MAGLRGNRLLLDTQLMHQLICPVNLVLVDLHAAFLLRSQFACELFQVILIFQFLVFELDGEPFALAAVLGY